MPVHLGNTAIGRIYLGSTAIGKAYLGSTLVYRSAPEDAQLTGYLGLVDLAHDDDYWYSGYNYNPGGGNLHRRFYAYRFHKSTGARDTAYLVNVGPYNSNIGTVGTGVEIIGDRLGLCYKGTGSVTNVRMRIYSASTRSLERTVGVRAAPSNTGTTAYPLAADDTYFYTFTSAGSGRSHRITASDGTKTDDTVQPAGFYRAIVGGKLYTLSGTTLREFSAWDSATVDNTYTISHSGVVGMTTDGTYLLMLRNDGWIRVYDTSGNHVNA